MTARQPRWEVCRSDDGQFFARFRASNGQLLVTSETYKRKGTAIRLVGLVDRALYGMEVEIRDLTSDKS